MTDERAAPRRAPDFIGVGAQKAGTTWLARQLYRRPDVWAPFAKEIHHFDGQRLAAEGAIGPGFMTAIRNRLAKRIRRARAEGRAERLDYLERMADEARFFTDDWYLEAFGPAPAGAITGEITPRYDTLDEAGFDAMKALAPRAKLIYLIRDPAARALSAFRMDAARAGLSTDDPEAIDAWARRWLRWESMSRRAEYAVAVPRMDARWGPGEILYLPFGRIRSDPAAVLRAVEAHLGLEARDPTPDAAEATNRSTPLPAPDWLVARLEAAASPHRAFLAARFGEAFLAETR